jgi:NADH-quinone oxidoreductase subunit L
MRDLRRKALILRVAMNETTSALLPAVAIGVPALGAAAMLFRWGERTATRLAFLLMTPALGAAWALFVGFWYAGSPPIFRSFSWLYLPGGINISLSVWMDVHSTMMGALVSLIAWLVLAFSAATPVRRRYYGFLLLFVGAMQMLVFAGDVWTLFVAWELIGLCSFALIAYKNDDSAVRGARKAMLVNRLGDFAFWAGMLTLWAVCGTSELPTLFNDIHNLTLWEVELQILGEEKKGAPAWLNWALLGIFVGASTKAAQAPLSVWLPDAMVGPTPVSALLHSSTMVAAGVWVLIRFFPILTPEILTLTAFVGGFTALFAAAAALAQRNAKKILAYSTISQLGLMFLAVGSQFPEIAGFHLVTHAFYKCALFLCLARISHDLEQIRERPPDDPYDVYAMGGLRRRLPFTFAIFLLAAAALIGIPGTAGYVSKDAVFISAVGWALVAGVFSGSSALLAPAIAAILSVGFTAFYVVRMTLLIFGGKLRVGAPESRPPSRMPWMMFPLVVLALFFLWPTFGWRAFHDAQQSYLVERLHFAAPASLVRTTTELALWAGERYHGWIALSSGLLAAVGAALAVPVYLPLSRRLSRALPPRKPPLLKRWAAGFFGLDYMWERGLRPALNAAAGFAAFMERRLLDRPLEWVAARIADDVPRAAAAVEHRLLDGVVRLVARGVHLAGGVVRNLQTGKFRTHLFWALALFAAALAVARTLR